MRRSISRVLGAAAVLASGAADATQSTRIVLPPHLPAGCIALASLDYTIPAPVMLAIIKTESGGRAVVSRNANGSFDYGVAQHNTNSWVPFFEKKYGIARQSLIDSPCQSIRAQAYVLRTEMNSRECRGVDVWCAVGRYHAPNNMRARAQYVPKVRSALELIMSTGRFDGAKPGPSARSAHGSSPTAGAVSSAHAREVVSRVQFETDR